MPRIKANFIPSLAGLQQRGMFPHQGADQRASSSLTSQQLLSRRPDYIVGRDGRSIIFLSGQKHGGRGFMDSSKLLKKATASLIKKRFSALLLPLFVQIQK